MVVQQPKFLLKDVVRIIDAGDLTKIFYAVPEKSLDAVIAVFAETPTPKTRKDAGRYILDGIRALQTKNFVERQCLFDDLSCVADVYGSMIDGRPWYVKFYIDEGIYLEQVSFHPPDREMMTVDGTKIQAGEWIYEKMRKLWVKRVK